MKTRRRDLLRSGALAAGAALSFPAAGGQAASEAVVIDPKPLFDISPHLYMQFMEPLGTADSSVEAAWDYDIDDWRKDLVAATKDLAPGVIRWGGLYCRYYKWREGVGPAKQRPWMRNYVWGGKETNRVGTGELADFCRRVGAEPLLCVNFLSDGRKQYSNMPGEGNRTGDAREAADWVSYANDPDNRERRSHGAPQPYGIKLWQLGNETSYGSDGFSRSESIARTIEFAKAMKARDPSIRLIGWGDRGPREDPVLWAPDLIERAGEHIDMVAMHMMGQSPQRRDTVLRGLEYQKDPQRAWEELLELAGRAGKRLTEFEQAVASRGTRHGIAVTEGHLSLSPHNANPLLYEWLSAAYHALTMNAYQRHGARVRIATGADFCGTRWTVNAVMIQVPRGVSYLMPVGCIMRLFKRHNGKQGVAAASAPAGLDVAASRSGDKVYLHVANTEYARAVPTVFRVSGRTITGGRVFEIAPETPREYASQDRPDVFRPREKSLPPGPSPSWRFPAASVSAVELDLQPERG